MELKMSAALKPVGEDGNAYILAFQGNRLLVVEEETYRVPLRGEFDKMNLEIVRQHYLGTIDDRPCYSIEVDENSTAPPGSSYVGLRELFGLVDEEIFSLAIHAVQIINWDRMNQYCGQCGAHTDYGKEVRAKICRRCSAVYYPRLSPAVIVAVKKDKELLLLRNKHRKQGFYSVLAGFVEPGENLEECLVREVREEAGIEVKNIKYFGSQSWPFPDALMIAFTAEYAGGEISIDNEEIADAGWFRPDNFPRIPGKISIARHLIDEFVKETVNDE